MTTLLHACATCKRTYTGRHCPRCIRQTWREYGSTHRRLRASLAPEVAAGLTRCAKCHDRILPHQAWDLGHTDDRSGYTGPEHATCNRAAHLAGLGRAILW